MEDVKLLWLPEQDMDCCEAEKGCLQELCKASDSVLYWGMVPERKRVLNFAKDSEIHDEGNVQG